MYESLQTTVSVPTISFGTTMFCDTISATKLAVIPTMIMKQSSCKALIRRKVFAKGLAP